MFESQEPIFISIEGNIGCGKSTLLTKLQNYIEENTNIYEPKHIVFLKEPVELWEKYIDPISGKNILKLYYENPSKYAFQFQSLVFSTQKQMIRETMEKYPECHIIISERSIDVGIHVFSKMLAYNHIFTELEYNIYLSMIENNPHKPLDEIIYIDVSPDICMERIHTRGRDGENNITLEYLSDCQKYYFKWLKMVATNNKEISNQNDNIVPIHILQNNDLTEFLPILQSILNKCCE
jgi:deoxycitidine kinase